MPELEKIVEALIFASDFPLPSKKIKEILETDTEKEIKEAISKIKKNYKQREAPLDIIEVAGGFQNIAFADRFVLDVEQPLVFGFHCGRAVLTHQTPIDKKTVPYRADSSYMRHIPVFGIQDAGKKITGCGS